MTTDNETLRSLVKETTALLRDLIMDQGKQVAEMRESLSDIKDLNRRLERFDIWKDHVDTILNDLCTKQAVDEYSRTVVDRDETRAYGERKEIWKSVLDISIRLAGVAALIIALLEL